MAMSLLPRHITSCMAVSRSLELAKYGVNHLLPLATTTSQANLCQRQGIKTQKKSSMQVVKKLKPARVIPHQKKNFRPSPSKFRNEERHGELPHPNSYDEEFEVYEDRLASRVSQYSSKMAAHQAEVDFTRSLVKGLNAVKYQTIKQKHFRQAPPPNLLTWAAKEQIRYLHQSNPEDWTVETLTEYFPVNEKAVKKILKSNRRMFQEKDILRHDEKVLTNWSCLHSHLESGTVTEDDVESWKCFFNSQNDCLVANAVCLSHMPSPISGKRRRKNGLLSVIVEDCLKEQDKDTQVLLREKIPSVTHQLSTKLEEISLHFQKIASEQKKMNRKLSLAGSSSVHVDISPQARITDKKRFSSDNDDKSSGFNKGKPTHSGTYISSKTVYDENGEFLYKIP